ncbi:hypothetical protein VP01_3920g1 [Puccinia sorghi]|uniref:OTU domain-containing protein n=1 Tax=Puccinia sorghi TaxID=27349 RepID=A0A0L6UTF1_9BASI|nr:hypothetical protein VP01_3920g1 [Puccinia sorghi]
MVHKFAIEQGALIEQLPEFIQSHFNMVIDVKADGPCGYHVVAHSLGRGEELEFYSKEYTFSNIHQTLGSIYPTPSEPVGTKHWMSMPSMVEAIANAFESPVFFFSPNLFSIMLPSLLSAQSNSRNIYCISTKYTPFCVLNDEPYEFPAPRYLKNWEKSATKEALGWAQLYSPNFQKAHD